MRTIKFRAWDSGCDVMFDLFNDYPKDSIKKCLLGKDEDITVMQFTGLEDKNGKEIYEGDIVNAVYHYTDGGDRHKVETKAKIIWDEIGFDVSPLDDMWISDWNLIDDVYKFEIIGNIYENKELL